MLENLIAGFLATFTLGNFAALVFGSMVGIVVGILPGLGPMVGMVVLLPVSFSFAPDVALSLLLGVFCGGYFGGAIPAVLLRTPGVPSSLITSFDGYPLTQKGEAQTALSATLLGSFGGGVISVLILIFLAPLLAKVAASFGPPEYFMVAVFGVVLVVMAFRDSLSQALILLGLGFWFSCVGIDGPTLSPRFNFGTLIMQNGLHIVPVCLGLFGIGQTLLLIEREIMKTDKISLTRSSLDFSKLWKLMKYWKTLIQSGVIGTFVGLLPGTGFILASFLSYDTAKKLSKEKERFGKGTPEGCIASEAGNNAVPAGAMIPLLTLGIPGDALSAVLLGVFTITRSHLSQGWISGLNISSSPASLSKEFISVVSYIKKQGLKTEMKTDGQNPEILSQLLKDSLIDRLVFNLKGSADLYESITGTKINPAELSKSLALAEQAPDYKIFLCIEPFEKLFPKRVH